MDLIPQGYSFAVIPCGMKKAAEESLEQICLVGVAVVLR